MAIEKELLDQLLAGRDPNEVFAKDGLLDDLKKALSERLLDLLGSIGQNAERDVDRFVADKTLVTDFDRDCQEFCA